MSYSTPYYLNDWKRWNVNEMDQYGIETGFGLFAPVHISAHAGLENVLRRLIDSSEPYIINLKRKDSNYDSKELTPLMISIIRKHKAFTRILLKKSTIQVNLKDDRGHTALHHAAMSGDIEITKSLLEKEDVELNPRDFRGCTPLCWAAWAASEGDVEAMALLLDRGGNELRQCPRPGCDKSNVFFVKTELFPCMTYDTVAIRLLLKRGVLDINETYNQGRTLLSHAVERAYGMIVEMLLDEGAEPNSIADEGWTPLWWALDKARDPSKGKEVLRVVRLLIEYGAVLDDDARKKLETQYGEKWDDQMGVASCE
jgi:ankyrin repeat protein